MARRVPPYGYATLPAALLLPIATRLASSSVGSGEVSMNPYIMIWSAMLKSWYRRWTSVSPTSARALSCGDGVGAGPGGDESADVDEFDRAIIVSFPSKTFEQCDYPLSS
jgi:hypothetical protein